MLKNLLRQEIQKYERLKQLKLKFGYLTDEEQKEFAELRDHKFSPRLLKQALGYIEELEREVDHFRNRSEYWIKKYDDQSME